MTKELTDKQYEEWKADKDLVSAVLGKYLDFMRQWQALDKARERFPLEIGDIVGKWHDRVEAARGVEATADE